MATTMMNNENGEPFHLPPTLKPRCMRIHGWTDELADQALQGYGQFMKLKVQMEDWKAETLSPSLTIDLVWRQHVLDVGHYEKACIDYCGRRIEHDPDSDLDENARTQRVKSTKIALKALFGSHVNAEIWCFGEITDEQVNKKRHEDELAVGGQPFRLPATLKARCMRIHGWNDEFADQALLGYRQFMKLKAQLEDWKAEKLSPSLSVDLVWHQHILDSGHYKDACVDYCGNLIEHNPDGDLNAGARSQQIKSTKCSLEALFGRQVNADIWCFGTDQGNKKRRHDSSLTDESSLSPETPVESPNGFITIQLRPLHGESTFFKMRKTTPFEKAYQRYADDMGHEVARLRFLNHGEKIGPHQTPKLLGLEENDEIGVFLDL